MAPQGSSQVALDDLPGPACLLGDGGRIEAHNAAFAAWAGRAEVHGLPLSALFPGDPVVAGIWEEARRGPVEHHAERRARAAAGPSFWSLRAAPTATGVIVCASDVTAFARAAQAMHAAQRAWVSMAVHELRAPLTAIKAWAGALGGRPRASGEPPASGPGVQTEGLAAISRKVDQMDELISDLLEAARSDAAAVRPDRRSTPIDALVRRAAAASPHAARAAVVGAAAGRARVDASHLELTIGKLIAFVARRQAEGPVAVTLGETGGEIHVQIADRGPPEADPTLADPFGHAGRLGRGRGPGLGLYLAQQLVIASGGRLWREADGGGARFVVALPAAEGADPEPRAAHGGAEPPLEVFARVLVVEPDAARRARTAALLRLAGHEVTTAAEPAPFERGRFDAVVADAAARGAIEAKDAALLLIGPAAAGLAPGSAERAGALAVLPDPLDVARLVALVGAVAAARASK